MKRPLIVTLTYWMVLILSAWNALRAWTYFAWRDILSEYKASIPPMVGTGIAIVWVIIGMILAWGIWQKKPWNANLLLGVSAGYSVWYWSERLFWQSPHANVPFAIFVNLVCLIIIVFARKLLLREAYERNIENPGTK